MFTLRRAYYENISDLSYLYDDFNDRQLHLSHGIQMAGAELNALLKYLVTIEDYVPDVSDADSKALIPETPAVDGPGGPQDDRLT